MDNKEVINKMEDIVKYFYRSSLVTEQFVKEFFQRNIEISEFLQVYRVLINEEEINFIKEGTTLESLAKIYAKNVDNCYDGVINFRLTLQKTITTQSDNEDQNLKKRSNKKKSEVTSHNFVFEDFCSKKETFKKVLEKPENFEVEVLKADTVHYEVPHFQVAASAVSYTRNFNYEPMARRDDLRLCDNFCDGGIPRREICINCDHKLPDSIERSQIDVEVNEDFDNTPVVDDDVHDTDVAVEDNPDVAIEDNYPIICSNVSSEHIISNNSDNRSQQQPLKKLFNGMIADYRKRRQEEIEESCKNLYYQPIRKRKCESSRKVELCFTDERIFRIMTHKPRESWRTILSTKRVDFRDLLDFVSLAILRPLYVKAYSIKKRKNGRLDYALTRERQRARDYDLSIYSDDENDSDVHGETSFMYNSEVHLEEDNKNECIDASQFSVDQGSNASNNEGDLEAYAYMQEEDIKPEIEEWRRYLSPLLDKLQTRKMLDIEEMSVKLLSNFPNKVDAVPVETLVERNESIAANFVSLLFLTNKKKVEIIGDSNNLQINTVKFRLLNTDPLTDLSFNE